MSENFWPAKLDSYKGRGAELWDRQEPRNMGDLRNRPQAIEMLGEIQGQSILEAGCGTGYVARLLAVKGAHVYGCDAVEDVVIKALEREKERSLGITYVRADITKLPFPDQSMDKIMCVGVLIHNDQKAIGKFLHEVRRVLKLRGELVIGVMHPELFEKANTLEKSWVRYTPLAEIEANGSQKFREDYYDKDSQLFQSEVWNHPADIYKKLIEESGLELTETKIQNVEKEDLIVPEWGTEHGYPAYLHMKVVNRQLAQQERP